MNVQCLQVLSALLLVQSLAFADASVQSPATTQPAVAYRHAPAIGPAAIIPLAGEINDYNRDALFRRFATARNLGAKTVILDISTYGGSLPPALDISNFIKRQDDLHVIAFVRDKAISAGALIAVACDEIVMAPHATIGDCAPIIFDIGGELKPLPLAERAKQEGPVVTEFLESADRNGHDRLLLESMVRVQTTVYYVQDDRGNKRFVDEQGYKELTAGGKWKPVAGVPCPVDGPETLLTVHTDEALALGLASGMASSPRELASQRSYTVEADLSPTVGDFLVEFLGNSFVRGILLMIFLQALYMGLSAPGHGAAEAVALISLGLLLGVPLLTGYAQWWDLLLIFGGLALVAFEVFVFPGHMVSAVIGSAMFLIGVLLTFVGNSALLPGAWHMQSTWTNLDHGVQVVGGALAGSILLSVLFRRFIPRLPYFNRLILPSSGGAVATLPGPIPGLGAGLARTDRWPFAGTVGRAVSDLKPGGIAEFPYGDDVRTTSVNSRNGYVVAGEKVVVREVAGTLVIVSRVAPPIVPGVVQTPVD